jgi:hypothetical protein
MSREAISGVQLAFRTDREHCKKHITSRFKTDSTKSCNESGVLPPQGWWLRGEGRNEPWQRRHPILGHVVGGVLFRAAASAFEVLEVAASMATARGREGREASHGAASWILLPVAGFGGGFG